MKLPPTLAEGQCEFLLGFETRSLLQPPFTSLCIGQGDFLLVSPCNLKGDALFDPEHTATPILGYSAESYSARLIEQHLHRFDRLKTYPVFESSMCQLHKEMALRGKGIAWLPDTQIQKELMERKLVAIQKDHYRIPYQVHLYRNSAPLRKETDQVWHDLKKRVNNGWQLTRPWYKYSTLPEIAP